jgi:hypothetical protein
LSALISINSKILVGLHVFVTTAKKRKEKKEGFFHLFYPENQEDRSAIS